MESITITSIRDSFRDDPEMLQIIYYLNNDLNNIFYHYGKHFLMPRENNNSTSIKDRLREIAIDQYYYFKSFKNSFFEGKTVISSAYFGVNQKLSDDDLRFIKCPWYVERNPTLVDYSLYKKAKEINKRLRNGTFQDLLSKDFVRLVKEYIQQFKDFIVKNNVVALLLAQESGFFEKIAIDVFNELRFPTFNVLHGYPGYYKKDTYDKCDYICVWGEVGKNQFIKEGIEESKIILTGHPNYQFDLITPLKNNLSDVLVLSKAVNGSQFDNDYYLQDRSHTFYYIEEAKKALKSVGVQSARLRLHPSENPEWYRELAYDHFYRFDFDTMQSSLSKSSLVIGPISTFFTEALYHKVNYVCFEPQNKKGYTILGFPVVPPFDGSINGIPAAGSTGDLISLLDNKAVIDQNAIKLLIDQTASFDIIKEKIAERINR